MSRRSKGEGSIYAETWTDARGKKRTRYVGELDLGLDANGQRQRKKGWRPVRWWK